MTTFGLTPQGFVMPRQSDILAALQASFRAQFGATVNLSDETVFGQIIGILSEREALWWEGLDDDVASSTPAGAEGVYVDNILALSGLTRLPAAATVTNPTPTTQPDGKVLFGLVLYGTAGTVIPQGALIQTSTAPTYTFTLDNQVTINAGQSALQRLFFSSQPTQGSYALSFETPSGDTVTTPLIGLQAQAQATMLTFAVTPTTGTFTLSIGNQTTASVPYNVTASALQAAIQALNGYSGVGVAGSTTSGFALTWPIATIPTVSVADSTNGNLTAVQPIQALVNALVDPVTSLTPFADVSVTQPSQNQLLFSFGAFTPPNGQPSSANTPQGLITVANNSLQAGNTQTNLAVAQGAMGAPAQAIATATCTQVGANAVPAGVLTVIGSTQQGWSGVTNQLDCLTGRQAESDEEAMARRTAQLSSKGNGPLASVVEQVQQVPGVSAAIGFSNLTGAAQQLLAFSTVPTSGQFSLGYGSGVTSALPYNASAGAVQAALGSLSGLSMVQVTGSYGYGYTVDFNGAFGGQATQLIGIISDSTGAGLTATFGRPPKSIEIVVEGGEDQAVAQAILQSAPAGIATYGAPVLQTTGSCTAGSAQINVASAGNAVAGLGLFMQGLRPNSVIAAISGTTFTSSLPALSTASNVALTASHTVFLKDAAGNVQQVGFSRPQSILIYVTCQLITDSYLIPGNPASGLNASAKFDPASMATVQADLIAIGNSVGIGGTIVARGTNGLVGSFNDIPGVLDFDLAFDAVPNPTNQNNISLQAEQAPLFNSFATLVSFT